MLPCPSCGAEGFEQSTDNPDQCTFCDGTEGGVGPGTPEYERDRDMHAAKPWDPGGELYDADPDCVHEEDKSCRSGVRCAKCGGWFCA